MNVSTDDLKNFISGVTLAASLASLYFTRVNWLHSNRPLVTAFVIEHSSGDATATFNLIIANTGNRPAVRVCLHAPRSEILLLFESNVDERRIASIESCFLSESEVPLLRNGEELTTSFGAFSNNPQNGKWLRYGAEIEISVTYSDLDGRTYESRQPLKIYAREGFGGSVWANSNI